MDDLNSDLILHVAQFVSVMDAAAWMQASKRYYYLIHHLRRVLGPEMVAASASSSSSSASGGVSPVESALAQLRQCPTLALCCNNVRSNFGEQVAARLPPQTVVLGAVSHDIQTCLKHGQVECSSPANILLGHLGSEASVQPFCWQSSSTPTAGGRRRQTMQWEGAMEQEVLDAFPTTGEPYEVFIVYCCGAGTSVIEEFIQSIQSRHPKAALVGGICVMGYVSTPIDLPNMTPGTLSSKRVAVLKQMYRNMGGSESYLVTLTEKQALVDKVYELLQRRSYVLDPHVDNGVFGVALRGNVPVRSVVSRGVKRLTPPDTTLVVEQSRMLGPYVSHDWQQDTLFRQPNDRAALTVVPAFHVIDEIKEVQTGAKWSLTNFLAACESRGESPDFCGVRRRKKKTDATTAGSSNEDDYEDAFELYAMDLHGEEKIRIPVMNSVLNSTIMSPTAVPQLQTTSDAEIKALEEAQVDFFTLDGSACMEHVEATMTQLKSQTEQDKDNVLAAMMFSCNGRGPSPGWLIRDRMADAQSFSKAFRGEVPCVGFYAGGEIGPLATAAPSNPQGPVKNLFQRGKAALQGFTAVFALFIAPKVDLGHVQIDDSPEHVSKFIQKHLSGSTAGRTSTPSAS